MKACPYCAEQIQDAAVVCRFCQRPLTQAGAAAPTATVTAAATWSPGVAAVLSVLIPGLGQVYKSQIGRGLAFLAGAVVGYTLLVVPGLVVHLAAVIDAASGHQTPAAPVTAPRELTPEEQERARTHRRQAVRIILGLVALWILLMVLSYLTAPQ